MKPEISVCILTANRPESLQACLTSLELQRDPPRFEIIVLGNGDASVPGQVGAVAPRAVVAVGARRNPGAARNAFLDLARGDLVLFLDDDVTVEPDLLARLRDVAAANPQAAVFGGPNVTPHASTPFQVVQGAVLSSLVGCGPVRRRYGRHPPGPANERWFTLCNLTFRRSAMIPFADELVCAEENGVLAEMARAGVRMAYDPSLLVFHQRRPTLPGFAAQMKKYGYGRGQLMRRTRSAGHLLHLVPPAFAAYVGSVPLAAVVGAAYLVPLGVYGAVVLAASAKIGLSLRSWRAALSAVFLIFIVHVCYGLGVLEGLVAGRSGAA